MRTDSFAALLDTPLRKIWYQEDVVPASEYARWCNKFSLDRNFIDDYEITPLGPVPPKPEGGSVLFDALASGNTKRWTVDSYALGYVITREMWDDDKHNQIRKAQADLRRVFAHLYETRAYENLNNATSTTAPYAGFGGEALLSTSHSIPGTGGTYSNRLAAPADISYTAVQSAMLNFHALVNRRGLPEMMVPKIAIVSGQDMFNAAEIFKNGPMEFGTDRNNKNFVVAGPDNNGFSDVVFSRYLTDTDSWFILSDKSDHDLSLVERVSPEFNTDDDFYTMNVLARGYCRIGVGHSEWRGVFGEVGA
jgi:hypothetical protein